MVGWREGEFAALVRPWSLPRELGPCPAQGFFKPKKSDFPGEGCLWRFHEPINGHDAASGPRKTQRLCSKCELALVPSPGDPVQEILRMVAAFSGEPD